LKGTEYVSNLGEASLPPGENRVSKRYLKILERWIPRGLEYYSDWPGRKRCGHFFGGCHWYGNETVGPAEVMAAASTSPEYDARSTGFSREELGEFAVRAVRYLCYTHDTGPEDCLRPATGIGRSETWGTKWGERGRGFFPESQCGHGIAGLGRICTLLHDRVDEETLGMVARIHEDYAERFGEMSPRSGVYYDTQMEENAWTSTGLTSCHLFLQGHPRAGDWERSARRWMFSTCSTPQDAKDGGAIQGGTDVRSIAGRTFTALPDYWAENHGFVHPTYTGSGVWSVLTVGLQLGLWGREFPGELMWNRRRVYENIKRMVDGAGHPVAPQGMDWHYLPAVGFEAPHAVASVVFGDGDAAALQLRGLRTAELRQEGNGGRLYDRDLASRAHDQQDPMIMRETAIRMVAWLYLFHRLFGPGASPSDPGKLEERMRGVRCYHHSGFVHHRHPRGQTSFSWRNSVMVLPLPGDGVYAVSPCTDSWLGRPSVDDRPDNHRLHGVRVSDYDQGFAAAMAMDRCQGSLRQEVLIASAGDGRMLSFERFRAMEDISIRSLDQGFLRVTNERFPLLGDGCRGRRMVYSPGGAEEFEGWLGESEDDDVKLDLGRGEWVNVDDMLGIRYRGAGGGVYNNRHHHRPYRAISDDLVLSRVEDMEVEAGQEAGSLAAVVVPGQPHDATPSTGMEVASGPDSVCLATDGLLAAANFGRGKGNFSFDMPPGGEVQVFRGCTVEAGGDGIRYTVHLGPVQAVLCEDPVAVGVRGSVRIDHHETGAIYATNTGSSESLVWRGGGPRVSLGRGRTTII